ncbi:MAG: chromate transporter [Clostridia bacterium]|nr:chromate transporter [Clostridia bacterium]
MNFLLFCEFFKIGLFAIGGGLVTIPFLYDLAEKTGWFSTTEIPSMIAVSESSPGPLGINMATYTGFTINGIFGSLLATLGLITPSVIIILLIANLLTKYRANPYVEKIFSGIKPAVLALILIAGITVFQETVLKGTIVKELTLFLLLFLLLQKTKIHPIFFILLSGIVGILFHF